MTYSDKLNAAFGIEIIENDKHALSCSDDPKYLPSPVRPFEMAVKSQGAIDDEGYIKFNTDDIQEDYLKTKEALDEVIDAGREALTSLIELAGQSEKARDYEVAANLIKTIAECSKDRMNIHKTIAELNEKTHKLKQVVGQSENNVKSGGEINVEKAIIYNTTDIINLLDELDTDDDDVIDVNP